MAHIAGAAEAGGGVHRTGTGTMSASSISPSPKRQKAKTARERFRVAVCRQSGGAAHGRRAAHRASPRAIPTTP
ncbi:dihydroorotase [Burkholderia pseudomallei]|nr:dihydroorotase [Burkholderia pseudomallei]